MLVVGRAGSKADKSTAGQASAKARLPRDMKVLQESLDTCLQKGGPTKVCKQCKKHRPLTTVVGIRTQSVLVAARHGADRAGQQTQVTTQFGSPAWRPLP